MKGRYFLLPMLDGWTTVFDVPGKRTTGTGAQTYAITGPGWSGTLPGGDEGIQVAHRAWCGCSGASTAPARRRTTRQCTHCRTRSPLVPLSAYGKPYTPRVGQSRSGIDMKTPCATRCNELDGNAYFKLLRRTDEDQSAGRGGCADGRQARQDRRRARAGLRRWQARPGRRQGHRGAPKPAQEKIMAHFKAGGDLRKNGWTFATKTGVYGTDYLQRAFITAIGLGANRPQDAVYPTSEAMPTASRTAAPTSM